jgi:hypothetical protein
VVVIIIIVSSFVVIIFVFFVVVPARLTGLSPLTAMVVCAAPLRTLSNAAP